MTTLAPSFQAFVESTAGDTFLRADESFPEAWHCWSDAERHAVLQAWGSGRPLLVRGEPGCGKSQLARAVAAVLGVRLFPVVIHPRFEAQDVLFRLDLVERLAQAQVLAQSGAGIEALALRHFVRKGRLWEAMCADAPLLDGKRRSTDWPRAVVLIDEIDKADTDVPNALLEVFANRSFTPPGHEQPWQSPDAHPPLVVITTNEDRELPPAFVRRCAVLNLRPDDRNEAGFVQWLLDRARTHRSLQALQPGGSTALLEHAARQVWRDRESARALELPTVGLAEYLDLLQSLVRLSGGRADHAAELLDRLAPYALVKQREQDQQRPPVAAEVADRTNG